MRKRGSAAPELCAGCLGDSLDGNSQTELRFMEPSHCASFRGHLDQPDGEMQLREGMTLAQDHPASR